MCVCVCVCVLGGGLKETDQLEDHIYRGGYYNTCYQHMMGEHGLNSSSSG